MNATEQDAVLTRFAAGPETLARALAGIPEPALDAAPPSGGWTIRQTVHHIADGDDLWQAGVKAALGATDSEFTLAWYWSQPQEVWAERWAYARRPVEPSLALLEANRAHVRQLLAHVPDAWGRSIGIRKPDGSTEPLTVGEIVGMQTDHLEHHLERIVALARELGGPTT